MSNTLDSIIAQMIPPEPTTSGRELLPGSMLSQGFECANEAIRAKYGAISIGQVGTILANRGQTMMNASLTSKTSLSEAPTPTRKP